MANFDDEFMEMREQAHECFCQTMEKIFEDFLDSVGSNNLIIGYKHTYPRLNKKGTLTITCEYPGRLIGYKGRGAEKLQNLLKDKFGRDYEIKFEEVNNFYTYDRETSLNKYRIVRILKEKGYTHIKHFMKDDLGRINIIAINPETKLAWVLTDFCNRDLGILSGAKINSTDIKVAFPWRVYTNCGSEIWNQIANNRIHIWYGSANHDYMYSDFTD